MGNAEVNSAVYGKNKWKMSVHNAGMYRPKLSTSKVGHYSRVKSDDGMHPGKIENPIASGASIRGEIMAIQAAQNFIRGQYSDETVEVVDLSIGQQNRSRNSFSPVTSINNARKQQRTEADTKKTTTPLAGDNGTKQNGRRENLKFGIDNILKADSKSPSPSLDEDSWKFQESRKFSSKRYSDSHSECYSSSEDCQGSDDCDGSASPAQSGAIPNEEAVKRLSDFFARQYHRLHYLKATSAHSSKHLKVNPYETRERSVLPRIFSDPLQSNGRDSLGEQRRRSESPKRPTFSLSPTQQQLLSDKERLLRESLLYRLSPTSLDQSPSVASMSAEFPFAKSQFPRVKENALARGNEKDSAFRARNSSGESWSRTSEQHRTNLLSSSETDDVFKDNLPAAGRHDAKQADLRRGSRFDWVAHQREINPFLGIPANLLQAARSTLASSSAVPLPPARQLSMSSPASISPPLPSNFSSQAWQAIAANYPPSLRHLMYPYAYISCNPTLTSTAAAAVAMAAMRSSAKTPSLTTPERTTASSSNSSPSERSSYDEKRKIPKKRRKWSRAVFSLVQRRGLEKSFQVQKYVAKPERRGLAEALGLTDAQVKIWFQNRRMKWRQELKNAEKQHRNNSGSLPTSASGADDTKNHLIAQSC